KMGNNNKTSSSSLLTSSIVEAITSYKKKTGKLILSKTALKWIPKDGAGSGAEIISIEINPLFSSKEGGPKAILKIGAKLTTTTTTTTTGTDEAPVDESYNFAFISSDPHGDRDLFKTHISEIIVQNRAQIQIPPPTTTEGSKNPSNSNEIVPPRLDNKVIKKRVLQSHPDLRQLHKEMVIGAQISESEFWHGREDLLFNEARLDNQKIGRSAQMVDPRPETTDNGEIRISITPQMIKDIFEQYPVVQKAYNENVPPLNDQTFWTRYFRSKLFNRHKSSARQSGDAVKEDEILDKYLDDEDDGVVPKNINQREINRLLDLNSTLEDHTETGNSDDWTMRPGTQRSSLPLMRRFNEHSQRVLDSTLSGFRRLNNHKKPERIILDMREQERYFEGSAVASNNNNNNHLKRKRTVEEDVEVVQIMAQQLTREWNLDLGSFKIRDLQLTSATTIMLDNIAVRDQQQRGFNEDFLNQMVSTYTTTNEFLRQFWTAILPNPISINPTTTTLSSSSSSTTGKTKEEQEEEQNKLNLMMVKPTLTVEQKALKSQRMINFLSKTNERIQNLINLSHSFENDVGFNKSNIVVAFNGLLKSVEIAQKYYSDRTSS
ncbi:hypothetical protein PSHT_06026, partial [Puccinia striiformis]